MLAEEVMFLLPCVCVSVSVCESCIGHHGAQAGPMSMRSGVRYFFMFDNEHANECSQCSSVDVHFGDAQCSFLPIRWCTRRFCPLSFFFDGVQCKYEFYPDPDSLGMGDLCCTSLYGYKTSNCILIPRSNLNLSQS